MERINSKKSPKTSLALVVRQYRLAKGWTLKQMAEHTGVSPATLCRIERGQRPRKQTLERLSAVIGKDLRWLFPPPSELLSEGWRPLPQSEEVIAEIVFHLTQFRPASMQDLWLIVPAMSHPDWRVRRYALVPLYRMVKAGYEPTEAGYVLLRMAAFDTEEAVRQAAEIVVAATAPAERPAADEVVIVCALDDLTADQAAENLVQPARQALHAPSPSEALRLLHEYGRRVHAILVDRNMVFTIDEDERGDWVALIQTGLIQWLKWAPATDSVRKLVNEALQGSSHQAGAGT